MDTAETAPQKLKLPALTALVIGSIIGAGVFALPQNMASGAGPLAVLIGWAITGIGMLALVFVYQQLPLRLPYLNAGPYAYAKAGFGPFIGFTSAWGYWLSAWLGNVSFAIILFSALSYFWPVFGDGNSWQAVTGASLMLWLMHLLALRGLREAAFVNLITTTAKLVALLMFIAIVYTAFYLNIFVQGFQEFFDSGSGTLLAQVKNTMLVTLWVFIGIEGASVISARAERRTDIGKATLAGFLVCLAIYSLVSLLSFGVLSQSELAALKNPSMAGVLEHIIGPWGAIFINVALVISVAGASLSWMLLASEIPYTVAKDGLMPRFLLKENEHGAPIASLWVTNGFIQLFLILALFTQSTYQTLLFIASVPILVPYLFSGLFAMKLALTGQSYIGLENRNRDFLIGLVATIFGAWLVYAAGPRLLFLCAILYLPGILLYALARHERKERLFTPAETIIAGALVVAGIIAAYLLLQHQITIG